MSPRLRHGHTSGYNFIIMSLCSRLYGHSSYSGHRFERDVDVDIERDVDLILKETWI